MVTFSDDIIFFKYTETIAGKRDTKRLLFVAW